MSNRAKYINTNPSIGKNITAQQINEPEEFDLDELDLHSNENNGQNEGKEVRCIVL